MIDMVVRRHGCPRERIYLQERHVCQAFQEAILRRSFPPAERIEMLTSVFGAAPKAGPDDAVKIQNEIRAHLMKAGKPAFVEETFVNFERGVQADPGTGRHPLLPDAGRRHAARSARSRSRWRS